jgi:ribosome-associated translation inhibitor RaiA
MQHAKEQDFMQVQTHTDKNISAGAGLPERITGMVEDVLGHFGERITRVEVHLSDLNSGKGGNDDIRCVMEARLQSHRPVTVTEQAANVQLALQGAGRKLRKSVESILGRLNDHHKNAPPEQ